MERGHYKKGVFLVAMSGACFGLIPAFTKMAYSSGTGLYTLLFLRFMVGTVFMLGYMFFRKVEFPSPTEIFRYYVLGAIGYLGQSLCYFLALNYTTSSVVALILSTYPAMVMLGSALFLKEAIMKRKLLSLALTLCGSFLIIGSEFDTNPIGIILSVSSAVFYSAYIIVSSRVIRPGMDIQASAFIMLGVGSVYGIFSAVKGFVFPMDPVGWTGVILIGVVSTAFAFCTFFAGMKYTGPSTASLASATEPVVAVLASTLLLSEPITAHVVIGGCLILSALFITSVGSGTPETAY